ncbi:MAG: tyrosine-type recombinase/integrase [Bryobacteraceae bacterium]
MRRKRFQKGSVRPRKHGRQKVWVAQWWEHGEKKSKVLGRCTDMPKSEAEARLAVILKPFNEGAGQSQKPIYTFRVYLEELFLPAVRRKWKESTRVTTEPRMTYHLLPGLGDHLLQQITREQMQGFLDQKAITASRSIVDHLRWDLNSIFRMALSDGLVPFNPAAGLFTPPCKPEAEKRVLTPAQVPQSLGVFGPRERLIFRLAVFEGLRPGEILALRLVNVFDDHVSVEQRVYKGTLDTPKGRKGRRTARKVALSPGTAMELTVWRSSLLNLSPEAYLFPTERNTPLSRDNLWNRHLRPKLETVGLEWATFQVLRRTNASLSRKAKIDDKVSADQRGHGLGVSMEVYSLSDLEQKSEAVKRLESEVIQ